MHVLPRLLVAPVIGALISFFAWFAPPLTLVLLLALPFCWARARTRWEAGGVIAGYFFQVAIDVPTAYLAAFPESYAITGWAVLAVDAAVLSVPWVVLWPGSPSRLSVRSVALALACVLPPFGLLMWGSPYLAAGVLFPGFGAAGIVLMVIAVYLAAAAGLRAYRWNAIVALGAVAVAANATFSPPSPPDDWVGIQTELGEFPKKGGFAAAETLKTLSGLATTAVLQGKKVVVLPEEAAGLWTDTRAGFWLRTSIAAKANGATVLIGADIKAGEGNYLDAIKVLDGGILHAARVPMPIGGWRPWDSPSVTASPLSFPLYSVRGLSVGFSVCYEDFLLWPHLHYTIRRPDVLVSTVNNWMVRETSAADRQRASIEATARLIGVPLVRSVNR